MQKNIIYFTIVLAVIILSCCDETPPQRLPVIENFTLTPLSGEWHVGDKITISWSVKNAESVTIDNGIGSVPLSGTYVYTVISPGAFNFTLTATNSVGTVDQVIPYSVADVQIYELWEKWFYGLLDAEAHNLIQCSNGDYLIVGATKGYHEYDSDKRVMLIRIDSIGNTKWQKYFHRGDGCFGQSAAEMPDGSFIVAANNHYSNYPQNDYLFYLLQTSSAGDLIWEKNVGGYHWRTWDCMAADDGNYIITGESSELTGNPGFRQLYLGEFNGSKPIWEKSYSVDGPAVSEASGRKLLKTSDGGFAFLGMNRNEAQGKDIYLIKTDGSGTLLWQKTIGKAALVNEDGKDFIECDDEGFLIVGYTDEQNDGDIYVVKTDSAGNTEWEMTKGSKWQDTPSSVIKCSDGNYLIAWNTFEKPRDAEWGVSLNLLKINSAGKILWQLYREGVFVNYRLEAEHIIETDEGEFLIISSADVISCCPSFINGILLQKVRIF